MYKYATQVKQLNELLGRGKITLAFRNVVMRGELVKTGREFRAKVTDRRYEDNDMYIRVLPEEVSSVSPQCITFISEFDRTHHNDKHYGMSTMRKPAGLKSSLGGFDRTIGDEDDDYIFQPYYGKPLDGEIWWNRDKRPQFQRKPRSEAVEAIVGDVAKTKPEPVFKEHLQAGDIKSSFAGSNVRINSKLFLELDQ